MDVVAITVNAGISLRSVVLLDSVYYLADSESGNPFEFHYKNKMRIAFAVCLALLMTFGWTEARKSKITSSMHI